jgi:5-methylthioadenosine/S-adenosylhomocysteine deaminase
MKLTALFNKSKYRNPTVMPARDALRMATIEGARAIGLGEEVGPLEAGKMRQFIFVVPDKPSIRSSSLR